MKLPVNETHLSEGFRKIARINGFNTLGELLSIKLTHLLQMEWLSLTMLEEIAYTVKNLRRKDIS